MTDEPLARVQGAIGASEIRVLKTEVRLGALIRGIRQAAADSADPLPVAGVLLEGVVHLLKDLPQPERDDAVAAFMQLLSDRLTALGHN